MQSPQYSRLNALVQTVRLLETLVDKCTKGEDVPDNRLVATGMTKDKLKTSLKNLVDVCIVKDLEVQLLTEESEAMGESENGKF